MKYICLFLVFTNITFGALSNVSEVSGRIVGFDTKTVTLLHRYGKTKVAKSQLNKDDLKKIKSGAEVTFLIPTPQIK